MAQTGVLSLRIDLRSLKSLPNLWKRTGRGNSLLMDLEPDMAPHPKGSLSPEVSDREEIARHGGKREIALS